MSLQTAPLACPRMPSLNQGKSSQTRKQELCHLRQQAKLKRFRSFIIFFIPFPFIKLSPYIQFLKFKIIAFQQEPILVSVNEAEYLMKNYGDRGGCYPSRPYAEGNNTLQDLHNFSYDTKAEFNNCFIIHSK